MPDHETIVTGGGSSAGLIAGIVIALLVVFGLFFFVNVPAVSVDVTPDGQ